jgi:hypothetical protein
MSQGETQLVMLTGDEPNYVTGYAVGKGDFMHECEEHGMESKPIFSVTFHTIGNNEPQTFIIDPQSWLVFQTMVTNKN